MKINDVIIVGGGLSGLYLSYLLKKEGYNIKLIEKNNILGGRIKTIYKNNFPFEMGANWVFNNNFFLKKIINDFKLEKEFQYIKGLGLYENNINNFQEFDTKNAIGAQYIKLTNGSYSLIDSIASKLYDDIILNEEIIKIEDKINFLELSTKIGKTFLSRKVVLAIPPKILASSILFEPKLDNDIQNKRLKTHTWMADSVKFSIQFKNSFWRKKNMSGLVIANYGIIREVQDQSNLTINKHGLVGFLNLNKEQFLWDKNKRLSLVIKDLTNFFGNEAKEYVDYEEMIWENNFLKNINKDLVPHQFNGDNQLILPEMNDKLFFASAETSINNPGIMEGAIESSYRVLKEIINSFNLL